MRRSDATVRSLAVPTALSRAVDDVLGDAELRTLVLPESPELQLLLLRDTLAGRALDAAATQRVMNNPLYWVFCWASGRVLARYILDHPELLGGKRVLDFGCGSGVVAIAAALAGARDVVACDSDPLARRATAYNAALNGVKLTLSDDFDAVSGSLDLIMVADVLYDRENLAWLRRFLDRADQVLVADSRVRDFEEPGYERVSAIESCTLPDLDESREFNRVSLYRGRRPRD